MSFFDRFTTTLRADANGLIDAIEEPSLLLKQHLRDAELAVHQKRARLSQLEAEAKRLTAERQRVDTERARLDRDAEFALANHREDLARYALGLLLPKLRLTEHIDARLAALAEESRELALELEAERFELEELRARVQAYIAPGETASCEARFEPVSEEQIELELLRRKARGPARDTSQARTAPEAHHEKA